MLPNEDGRKIRNMLEELNNKYICDLQICVLCFFALLDKIVVDGGKVVHKNMLRLELLSYVTQLFNSLNTELNPICQ